MLLTSSHTIQLNRCTRHARDTETTVVIAVQNYPEVRYGCISLSLSLYLQKASTYSSLHMDVRDMREVR